MRTKEGRSTSHPSNVIWRLQADSSIKCWLYANFCPDFSLFLTIRKKTKTSFPLVFLCSCRLAFSHFNDVAWYSILTSGSMTYGAAVLRVHFAVKRENVSKRKRKQTWDKECIHTLMMPVDRHGAFFVIRDTWTVKRINVLLCNTSFSLTSEQEVIFLRSFHSLCRSVRQLSLMSTYSNRILPAVLWRPVRLINVVNSSGEQISFSLQKGGSERKCRLVVLCSWYPLCTLAIISGSWNVLWKKFFKREKPPLTQPRGYDGFIKGNCLNL